MKQKILPYILLIIVGLALLLAPILYHAPFAIKLATVAKAVATVSSGITFDMVIDYAQKILGIVVTVIGIVQATRTVHVSRKRRAK